MDLVGFLEARLAEDETAARAVPEQQREWVTEPIFDVPKPQFSACDGHVLIYGEDLSVHAVHSARHDPARALREVEAKRAILADHIACEEWNEEARQSRDGEREICVTLRALAAVFSDHPDYREEWGAVSTEHAITVYAFRVGGGGDPQVILTCSCGWASGGTSSIPLAELNRIADRHCGTSSPAEEGS
jgi:hypothetical protein